MREFVGRYRGSTMGIAWSFFHPILMLAVYTVFFSMLFRTRGIDGIEEGKTGFAIFLFVGIMMHGFFAECVNRAPRSIIDNVNYVKKVVFPVEILPWTIMISALFHALISLVVLLVVQLALDQNLPWTIIFIPMIFLPLMMLAMGFAWFLAAAGVFFRDVGQVTGVFTTVLLFLSPVFYSASALPEPFRSWINLNPLSFVIGESRHVLIEGLMPNWALLGTGYLGSFVVMWAGFWCFQRLRPYFANVL